MSLRALSSRVIRPYIPVAPTAWTAFRGYASKFLMFEVRIDH